LPCYSCYSSHGRCSDFNDGAYARLTVCGWFITVRTMRRLFCAVRCCAVFVVRCLFALRAAGAYWAACSVFCLTPVCSVLFSACHFAERWFLDLSCWRFAIVLALRGMPVVYHFSRKYTLPLPVMDGLGVGGKRFVPLHFWRNCRTAALFSPYAVYFNDLPLHIWVFSVVVQLTLPFSIVV